MKEENFIRCLIQRFKIEKAKQDRSGVYAYTQRVLAYNSNKIEGSTLTEEQTLSLFEDGILPESNEVYKAKDVEEMSGHFLMFHKMIETLEQDLTQDLIKTFHYELKSGVFEDRANGYVIGDYKKRPNMVGMNKTTMPEMVESEMEKLLVWYHAQKVSISILAEFHAKYEAIHPFQDGNGRTGRLILFRECLKNNILPIVIKDRARSEYIKCLRIYKETENPQKLAELFQKEQAEFEEELQYFLPEDGLDSM